MDHVLISSSVMHEHDFRTVKTLIVKIGNDFETAQTQVSKR
jgi:hypothetical protein